MINEVLDRLFCDPDTRWIAIMNNRGYHAPNTDILALAYPERTYGYSADVEINPDDISALIEAIQSRGFELQHMNSRWNSDDPEYAADSLLYSIPGAKSWRDFIPEHQTVVTVGSTEKCKP